MAALINNATIESLIELNKPLNEQLAKLPYLATNSSLITEYASDLNAEELIKLFEKSIPPALASSMVDHAGCVSCAIDLQIAESEPTNFLLPESRERRALALTEAFFIHHQKPDDAFLFFEMLPGIEIVERCGLAPQIVCFDTIFYHAPFYDFETRAQLFNYAPAAVILETLTQHGYSLATEPKVGQVVVYSHGLVASHYARIESIDGAGRITVVSKFGDFHVYRHLLEVVPSSYGRIVTLLDPPRPWSHTSPYLILCDQRARGAAKAAGEKAAQLGLVEA